MTALSVGPGVIREIVRLAALEVPGVVRVGRARSAPGASCSPGRPSASASATAGSTSPSGWSPARASRSMPLTAQVRDAVGGAVERLLGLELGGVTVLVDGVGA